MSKCSFCGRDPDSMTMQCSNSLCPVYPNNSKEAPDSTRAFELWCKSNWNGYPSPQAWDAFQASLTPKISVIKALPNNGFAPSNEAIAKHLREQAAIIENSTDGVRTVLMIVEQTDGTLYTRVMGHSTDLAREVGLMSIACIRASVRMVGD